MDEKNAAVLQSASRLQETIRVDAIQETQKSDLQNSLATIALVKEDIQRMFEENQLIVRSFQDRYSQFQFIKEVPEYRNLMQQINQSQIRLNEIEYYTNKLILTIDHVNQQRALARSKTAQQYRISANTILSNVISLFGTIEMNLEMAQEDSETKLQAHIEEALRNQTEISIPSGVSFKDMYVQMDNLIRAIDSQIPPTSPPMDQVNLVTMAVNQENFQVREPFTNTPLQIHHIQSFQDYFSRIASTGTSPEKGCAPYTSKIKKENAWKIEQVCEYSLDIEYLESEAQKMNAKKETRWIQEGQMKPILDLAKTVQPKLEDLVQNDIDTQVKYTTLLQGIPIQGGPTLYYRKTLHPEDARYFKQIHTRIESEIQQHVQTARNTVLENQRFSRSETESIRQRIEELRAKWSATVEDFTQLSRAQSRTPEEEKQFQELISQRVTFENQIRGSENEIYTIALPAMDLAGIKEESRVRQQYQGKGQSTFGANPTAAVQTDSKGVPLFGKDQFPLLVKNLETTEELGTLSGPIRDGLLISQSDRQVKRVSSKETTLFELDMIEVNQNGSLRFDENDQVFPFILDVQDWVNQGDQSYSFVIEDIQGQRQLQVQNEIGRFQEDESIKEYLFDYTLWLTTHSVGLEASNQMKRFMINPSLRNQIFELNVTKSQANHVPIPVRLPDDFLEEMNWFLLSNSSVTTSFRVEVPTAQGFMQVSLPPNSANIFIYTTRSSEHRQAREVLWGDSSSTFSLIKPPSSFTILLDPSTSIRQAGDAGKPILDVYGDLIILGPLRYTNSIEGGKNTIQIESLHSSNIHSNDPSTVEQTGRYLPISSMDSSTTQGSIYRTNYCMKVKGQSLYIFTDASGNAILDMYQNMIQIPSKNYRQEPPVITYTDTRIDMTTFDASCTILQGEFVSFASSAATSFEVLDWPSSFRRLQVIHNQLTQQVQLMMQYSYPKSLQQMMTSLQSKFKRIKRVRPLDDTRYESFVKSFQSVFKEQSSEESNLQRIDLSGSNSEQQNTGRFNMVEMELLNFKGKIESIQTILQSNRSLFLEVQGFLDNLRVYSNIKINLDKTMTRVSSIQETLSQKTEDFTRQYITPFQNDIQRYLNMNLNSASDEIWNILTEEGYNTLTTLVDTVTNQSKEELTLLLNTDRENTIYTSFFSIFQMYVKYQKALRAVETKITPLKSQIRMKYLQILKERAQVNYPSQTQSLLERQNDLNRILQTYYQKKQVWETGISSYPLYAEEKSKIFDTVSLNTIFELPEDGDNFYQYRVMSYSLLLTLYYYQNKSISLSTTFEDISSNAAIVNHDTSLFLNKYNTSINMSLFDTNFLDTDLFTPKVQLEKAIDSGQDVRQEILLQYKNLMPSINIVRSASQKVQLNRMIVDTVENNFQTFLNEQDQRIGALIQLSSKKLRDMDQIYFEKVQDLSMQQLQQPVLDPLRPDIKQNPMQITPIDPFQQKYTAEWVSNLSKIQTMQASQQPNVIQAQTQFQIERIQQFQNLFDTIQESYPSSTKWFGKDEEYSTLQTFIDEYRRTLSELQTQLQGFMNFKEDMTTPVTTFNFLNTYFIRIIDTLLPIYTGENRRNIVRMEEMKQTILNKYTFYKKQLGLIQYTKRLLILSQTPYEIKDPFQKELPKQEAFQTEQGSKLEPFLFQQENYFQDVNTLPQERQEDFLKKILAIEKEVAPIFEKQQSKSMQLIDAFYQYLQGLSFHSIQMLLNDLYSDRIRLSLLSLISQFSTLLPEVPRKLFSGSSSNYFSLNESIRSIRGAELDSIKQRYLDEIVSDSSNFTSVKLPFVNIEQLTRVVGSIVSTKREILEESANVLLLQEHMAGMEFFSSTQIYLWNSLPVFLDRWIRPQSIGLQKFIDMDRLIQVDTSMFLCDCIIQSAQTSNRQILRVQIEIDPTTSQVKDIYAIHDLIMKPDLFMISNRILEQFIPWSEQLQLGALTLRGIHEFLPLSATIQKVQIDISEGRILECVVELNDLQNAVIRMCLLSEISEVYPFLVKEKAAPSVAPTGPSGPSGPSIVPTGPSAPSGPSIVATGPSIVPTGPSIVPTGPSIVPTGPSIVPTGPSVPNVSIDILQKIRSDPILELISHFNQMFQSWIQPYYKGAELYQVQSITFISRNLYQLDVLLQVPSVGGGNPTEPSSPIRSLRVYATTEEGVPQIKDLFLKQEDAMQGEINTLISSQRLLSLIQNIPPFFDLWIRRYKEEPYIIDRIQAIQSVVDRPHFQLCKCMIQNRMNHTLQSLSLQIETSMDDITILQMYTLDEESATRPSLISPPLPDIIQMPPTGSYSSLPIRNLLCQIPTQVSQDDTSFDEDLEEIARMTFQKALQSQKTAIRSRLYKKYQL